MDYITYKVERQLPVGLFCHEFFCTYANGQRSKPLACTEVEPGIYELMVPSAPVMIEIIILQPVEVEDFLPE